MATDPKKSFRYKTTILEESRVILAQDKYNIISYVEKSVHDNDEGTDKIKKVFEFTKIISKYVEKYGYQDIKVTSDIPYEIFEKAVEEFGSKF